MDQQDEVTNVVPISDGKRKKRKEKEQSEDKISFELIMRSVKDAINAKARGLPDVMLPFDKAFVAIRTDTYGRCVYGEVDAFDVVRIVELDYITSQIQKAMEAKAAEMPEFLMPPKRIREIAQFWANDPVIIDMPKDVRWADEHGLCMNRLPWNLRSCSGQGLAYTNLTPTWMGLLERMDNAEGFCAWIGSLFDYESSLQQYVWIYGEGNDGKSSIGRFLKRVFGHGAVSKAVPNGNSDKHWTSNLLGKRLVMLPDCNSTTFVTGGLFKSLTGGDPIMIDPKFQAPYTATLKCKFLLFSNHKPSLNSEQADLRRIIYCPMRPRDKDHENAPDFEDNLWEEGGEFLSNCLKWYHEVKKGNGEIRLPNPEDLYNSIEINESDYEIFCTNFLEPVPIDENTPYNAQGSILSRDMAELVRGFFGTTSSRKQGDFASFLERHHGVRRMTVKEQDGTVVKKYLGATLSDAGRQFLEKIEAGRKTTIAAFVEKRK